MLKHFRPKNRGLRVGLCLTDQSVALLVVDKNEGGENKYQAPVIQSSFYCERSSLSGVKELEQKVSQFIDDNNLKNADCYCVLSKEDYQLLLIEPPEVPETELLEAMRWKVRDLVNVDVENMVVNIFPQPEKNNVYTVVTDKAIISSLVEFIKNIGLSLKVIDIEELSYRNYFDHYLVHDRGIAVVNISKNEGKLLIIKNSNLYLARTFSINYGGGAFDDLPEDEIILEVQRSLDYYERQMGQAAPAEILFVGAVAKAKITEAMQDNFQQKLNCIDISNVSSMQDIPLEIDEILKISGTALRGKVA